MFDYSKQIESFRDKKVRLTASMKQMLRDHRKTNRNKIKKNLPTHLPKVTLTDESFSPQGSFQMNKIIQTKFEDQEYDVDDGLLIKRNQLTDDDGEDLESSVVREAVRKSLVDKRFNKQPILCANCVRVFYADTDEKKHHIDFPTYRTWKEEGEEHQQISNEEKWLDSNPSQVGSWFAESVSKREEDEKGFGTQLRRLIQLTKRFAKSRESWIDELPNGMKLTMLAEECHDEYHERIDEAFRALFDNMEARLEESLEIKNRAHPEQPPLTRTKSDQNVKDLKKRIREALNKIETLDLEENDNEESAREVWDWIFQADGYFEAVDGVELSQKSFSSSLALVPDVPWQEKPVWKQSLVNSISISGRWKPRGGTWATLPTNFQALPKHSSLRFTAATTAPKPYSVHWQIVNSGSQAFDAQSLRGEIMPSKTAGAGGLHSTTVEGIDHDESTLYQGKHWVICYLVKDSICIAQSEPFVVNVQ